MRKLLVSIIGLLLTGILNAQVIHPEDGKLFDDCRIL